MKNNNGNMIVKTDVTKEMVSDLKNIDFYVKKSVGVKPINNNVITIKEYDSNPNFFKVDINYVFLDRLLKLYKITKKNDLDHIIKIIEICENNKSTWFETVEDGAVTELSNSINKDIINRLVEMGMNNHNKNKRYGK